MTGRLGLAERLVVHQYVVGVCLNRIGMLRPTTKVVLGRIITESTIVGQRIDVKVLNQRSIIIVKKLGASIQF
jgi:hypothetical protein